MKYLRINLADITGKDADVAGTGNFIHFFIREDLGDKLLPGAYIHKKKIDESWIVIQCENDDRPAAIQGGLEVIGRSKLGRKIRNQANSKLPSTGKYGVYRFVPPKSQGEE